MISLLEIAERSQKGPRIPEKEWDLNLFKKISFYVGEYGIKYDGKEFFNTDETILDGVIEGAIEFIAKNGVYCVTTNRIIQFEEHEIRSALRETPKTVVMGEGKDARIFKQRKIEEDEPLGICPGHHSPFTSDIAPLAIKNFAQIPRTDFLEGPNFLKVNGWEISNAPAEAYASMRESRWLKEGVREAGRPGLSVLYYPIHTRASTMLAGMADLGTGDGVLLSVLPDVKVEHDLLTSAVVSEEKGNYRVSGSFAIAGGFCGGPEGAIFESVLKTIAGILCYHDQIHYVGVEHSKSLSAREIMMQPLNWARSVVFQTLNAKTNAICMLWAIPSSGPCTEQNLWEHAVRAIEAVVNGGNIYAPRHVRTEPNLGQTPLEAEWLIEVSDAVIKSGLNARGKAAIIIEGIIREKLAGRVPERGKTIVECYDLVKHQPTQEYRELYERVKRELAELGLVL
jgi:methylamine--corrinoid protein Co-methyltransferase